LDPSLQTNGWYISSTKEAMDGNYQNGNSQALRFGVFDLDVRTQELRKYGTRVKLPRQSFRVLQMLLERRGTLVTREELQKALWSADTFVDFDHGLNNAVKRIRTAIGDSAETPHWIETLPRLGYRFIGPVEVATNGHPLAPVPTAGHAPAALAVNGHGDVQIQSTSEDRPTPFAAEKSSRTGWRWTIASLTLFVIAALLGWHYRERRSGASADGLQLVPFTSYPGYEFAPAFSPDGNQIAFSWSGSENSELFDLFVKVVGTDTPVQLTHDPSTAITPAWSPDGRFIAFTRVKLNSKPATGVFLIPAVGGPERKLASLAFGKSMYKGGIAWTPDSQSLIYPEPRSELQSELVMLNIDTLQRQVVAKPSARCNAAGMSAFSPDGRWLAFACMFDYGLASLCVQSWPIGTVRELLELTGDLEGLAWAADGQSLVYSRDNNLWRIPSRGGSPQRLWFGQDASHPTIARTGSRLAFTRNQELYDIWHIPTGDPRHSAERAVRLAPSELVQLNAQYSPDGKRVVFESNRSGSSEVWVCDVEGSNLLRLTNFGGPLTGTPRWSPDGTRIVLDSRASGKAELYVVSSIGGTPQLLPTLPAGGSVPFWSHDGKWIYFSSDVDNVPQIFKISATGGTPTQLTHLGGFMAKETPDGTRLYYSRIDNGRIEIWFIGTDGGGESPVTGLLPHMWPAWDVTDRGFYYYDGMSSDREILFFDFATKRTRAVAQIPGRPDPFSHNISVSPDEKDILYTQRGHSTADIVLAEGFR
jgi:Tol biopolymer transport system component/DNA-binding winged helix-turn-helix (wHTH) protein